MKSSDGPLVAVIIVNWNGADETIACLDALRQSTYRHWRAYVVDNASTDDSVCRIVSRHPAAHLLTADGNRGYAGGFNLGRAQALADGADYLWLLNNDTLVAPSALDQLLAADRTIGPALLSPKIVYRQHPTRLWYAGGRLEPRLKSEHIGLDEPDEGQFDQLRPIDWATGCSLFCSAAVARRLGPMEEGYFLYLEDVDFSLVAHARGIPIYFVPEAVIQHAVSSSSDRLPAPVVWYYAWRNYYRLVSRHGNRRQRLVVGLDLLSRFAKIALRQTFWPAFRADPHYQARTQALIDVVRGRTGPARLRSLAGHRGEA